MAPVPQTIAKQPHANPIFMPFGGPFGAPRADFRGWRTATPPEAVLFTLRCAAVWRESADKSPQFGFGKPDEGGKLAEGQPELLAELLRQSEPLRRIQPSWITGAE